MDAKKTISIKFTPLPNKLLLEDGKTYLTASIFISVGITPDPKDDKQTLKDFVVFSDWPATLKGLLNNNIMTLAIAQKATDSGTPINFSVTGFNTANASETWKHVFESDLPVHHKSRCNFYADKTSKDLGARTVLQEKATGAQYNAHLQNYYNNKYSGTSVSNAAFNDTITPHLAAQTHSFNRAANRSRGGDERPWQGQLGQRKTLDFNNLVSHLGHFPDLLRSLGLIVDIKADISTNISGWDGKDWFISLAISGFTWPSSPAGYDKISPVLPKVAVHFNAQISAGQTGYTFNGFTAQSSAPASDAVSQRLVLVNSSNKSMPLATADDSKDLIRIDDLDAVGTAYKMNCEQDYRTHRTSGLAINHEQLHNSNNQSLLKGRTPDPNDANVPPVLYAEDLIRGYRVDVRDGGNADDISNVNWNTLTWYSLCQQKLNVGHIPNVDEIIVNEGWAAASQTYAQPKQDSPDKDTYLVVPGTLTRWEGWSICVPFPGNGRANNKDDASSGNDKYSNFDKLKIKKSVVPASLPKLRYGHWYQFRLRTVDIAGNGLPLDKKITDPATTPQYVTKPIRFTRPEGHQSPVLVPEKKIYEGMPDFEGIDQANKNHEQEAIISNVIEAPATKDKPEVDTITIKSTRVGAKYIVTATGIANPVSINYQSVKGDNENTIAKKLANMLVNDSSWNKAVIVKNDNNNKITITALQNNVFLGITVTGQKKEKTTSNNVPGREGETLTTLVVRSSCEVDDNPVIVEQDCIRHILPPQISPDMAIKSGAFDKKPGESFDWIHQHDGTVDPQGFEDVHQLKTPYLPDPDIRAFQISGSSVDPLKNTFRFYEDGWSWPNPKPWKIKLVPVKSTEKFEIIAPTDKEGVILINIPQASMLEIKISSVCTGQHLQNKSYLFNRVFPQHRVLSGIKKQVITLATRHNLVTTDNEILVGRATLGADSKLANLKDDLFPGKKLTLIHAVQKALDKPEIADILFQTVPVSPTPPENVRALGDTNVNLSFDPGKQKYQAKSSEKLQVFSNWHDYEDTPANFGKVKESSDKKVYEFALNYTDQDNTINPKFTDKQSDTKRRQITYRIDNVSRFGNYFASGTDLTRPKVKKDDNQEGSKDQKKLDIPSSAKPKAPYVKKVVPILSHKEGVNDLGTAQKTLLGNGLRIYLDRGTWFSSGLGEVLGVVVLEKGDISGNFGPDSSNNKIITLDKHFVSLIGKDITRNTRDIKLLSVANFDNNITKEELEKSDDYFRGFYSWKPNNVSDDIDKQFYVPEVKDKNGKTVKCHIVRYNVKASSEGDELYADILFKNIASYFPFVRLVIVRLQPNAIAGCHVSPIVQLDYCQLTSNRIVTVNHDHKRIQKIQIDTSGQYDNNNCFYVAIEKVNQVTKDIFKKADNSGSQRSKPDSGIGKLYPCKSDTQGNWFYERADGSTDGIPYVPEGHEIVVYEFENYRYDKKIPDDPMTDSKMRLVAMESVKIYY